MKYSLFDASFLPGTLLRNVISRQTRERRGKGVRVSVRSETPIVKNFNEFLRTDENKTELFRMIADVFTSFSCEKIIISTKDDCYFK